MIKKITKLFSKPFFKSIINSLFITLFLISSNSISAKTLEELLSMDLVVHFLDVGVGDAILIELPDSDHEVIIDGGYIRQGYNFLNYARTYIDNPVELAIITHPDYDHWSGISSMISSGYDVIELWDPGYNRDCKFVGDDALNKSVTGCFIWKSL